MRASPFLMRLFTPILRPVSGPFLTDLSSGPAAGVIALAFAAVLAGCASKNPLIDEPVAASRPTPAAKPSADVAAATTATTATPAAGAPAGGLGGNASGVQTEKEKRFLGFLTPYRPDIQQGNFISQEMVAQLKEGMTREQVLFILGTPLLADIFHANRWDYAFRYQKRNGEVTNSRVTVYFKDNRLARYEGGNLPTEEDYLARIAGSPPEKSKTAAPADAQKAPSVVNENQ